MLKRKINSYLIPDISVENYIDIKFDINEDYISKLIEKSKLFNEQKKIRLHITEKSSVRYESKRVNDKIEYFIVDNKDIVDLKKLSLFNRIQIISIGLENLLNINDLSHIDASSLYHFALSVNKYKGNINEFFQILGNFSCLNKLYLDFPRSKLFANIDIKFKKLTYLLLEGLNNKSKINFSELKNLEYLNLFCETVLQYDLHTLKSLRGLELYNCLKDENIDYISEMENLEAISIGSFRSLKRLPDFSKLKKLKSISLYNCNQLEDYTPLLNCPSLEYIGIDGVSKDYDISKTFCLSALPNLKKFGSFGNRGFILKPHLPEAQKLNEIFHGKYSPAFEHFYYYYLAEKPEDSYMQDFGNNNEPVE